MDAHEQRHLAVGADVTYVEARVGEEILVLAKRLGLLPKGYKWYETHRKR